VLVTSQPWAWSVSALMNSTVTVAPAGMMRAGLTMPPIRKVMSGPPGGTAATVKDTREEVNVMVLPASRAPGGTALAIASASETGTYIGESAASWAPVCCAIEVASWLLLYPVADSAGIPVPPAAGVSVAGRAVSAGAVVVLSGAGAAPGVVVFAARR
jgi:hypothetical protein